MRPQKTLLPGSLTLLLFIGSVCRVPQPCGRCPGEALAKDSQLWQMAGEEQRPSAHTTEPRALPRARAVGLEDLPSPSSLENTTDAPAPTQLLCLSQTLAHT